MHPAPQELVPTYWRIYQGRPSHRRDARFFGELLTLFADEALEGMGFAANWGPIHALIEKSYHEPNSDLSRQSFDARLERFLRELSEAIA